MFQQYIIREKINLLKFVTIDYDVSAAIIFIMEIVKFTGSLLFLGGEYQIGSYLLLLFLTPVMRLIQVQTTLVMHNFWFPKFNIEEMYNFLKNVALISALMIFSNRRKYHYRIVSNNKQKKE